MTSAPVKNPVDIMYAVRPDGTPSPKGDSNFAGNLKSAVEKNEQNAPKAPKTEERAQAAKKTDEGRTDKNKFDGSGMKRPGSSETVRQEADGAEKQLTDEQSDAVNEKIDSLMKRIEEVTGVDEEAILHAMENLGITGISLFIPENMTNLLMELTGTEDPMELVTNEDLFSSLQDLNFQASEMMGQLQETYDLSPEDMQNVMEQLAKRGQEAVPVPDEASDDVQSVQILREDAGIPAAETENTGKTAEHEYTEIAKEAVPGHEIVNADSVKEESSAFSENESAGDQNSAFDGADLSKDTSTKEAGGKEKTFSGPQHRTIQTDAHPVSHAVQEMTGQIPQNELNAVQEEPQVSYTDRMADTQRIADQIMEHMRVQLKEGITELEMQLHPASLGNVNVSLVSREGNITAQFTAQNEAVKNVIETQLVQLREQFEEQGIKVDAVEVAVADHQFEHRDEGSEQRNFQRSGSGAKRTRRINLEALSDEEISRLTEDADKIQVDMMSRNGNTVDFTA